MMEQNQKCLSTYHLLALLTPVPLILFTTEEITSCTIGLAKGVTKAPRYPHSFFLFHVLLFQ